MCLFFGNNVPRCDRALISSYMCSKNFNYSVGECKSLIEELEDRDYDIDTLRFSTRKTK